MIDIIMKEEAEGQPSLFALVLADPAKNTSCGAVKVAIRLRPGSDIKSVAFLREPTAMGSALTQLENPQESG